MRGPLRVAYAAIDGGRDYQTQALRDDDVRRGDLVATVAALAGEDLDLLAFPAGYFQVRDADAQRRLRDDMASRLDKTSASFGIVVGIDRWSDFAKRVTKKASADGHPYFALYRSPVGVWTTMRQVSVTAKEGTQAVVEARWRGRDLLLPDTDIAFLICGESWSNALLGRVVETGCRGVALHAPRQGSLQIGW